ncbi:fatty-acid amide hydrolase [Aspergillus cavernicola]|uniref:amidase n=1 Tax=Aspergillus cavernicola TaxID=176166 RepID=A0ABR4IPG2_9EURO
MIIELINRLVYLVTCRLLHTSSINSLIYQNRQTDLTICILRSAFPNDKMTEAHPQPDWKILVAERRKHLDALIPAEWKLSEEFKASLPPDGRLLQADPVRGSGILSNVELDITENYSAAQLLQRLAWGDVSSLDVTTAFCKRAAIAEQLTSCLTEHFFSKARERAQYLDEYLKREGKVVGPLHGLPISIKDCYCVKDIHTTVGYVSFLQNGPERSNSALVDLLLDLGAVLYVKTNIPQTMMTADSDNNIYGRTLNPHNTNLTAGGSSGGEGALIAFRGSILGVGTDLAGSIRIPSLCCGLYGFKPTSNRVPFGGVVTGAIEGIPGIEPSAGPLAQNLDDLEVFMSSILAAEPWRYDTSAIAAPWYRPKPQALLTIGVLPEDEQYPIHPPVRRALESAIEALKKKGHRIVRLPNEPARDVAYGNRLAFQHFIYGPQPDHISPSGEPLIASLTKPPSPMFSGPFPVSQDLEVFQKISALYIARKQYSEAWQKAFIENNLDVVLAPSAQNTAVPHDTYGWPPYTAVWNFVDYPACVIPYGKVSRELDGEPMLVKGDVQPSYDPEAVDGAPCSIQIITPRYQDEKCLAAARIIDKDIRD